MKLRPCVRCNRHIQVGARCPFCGSEQPLLPEDFNMIRVAPDPNMIFAYGPPDWASASAAYAPPRYAPVPGGTSPPDNFELGPGMRLAPLTWEARGYGYPVAEPEKTLKRRIYFPEFLVRWLRADVNDDRYRAMWGAKRLTDEIWLYNSMGMVPLSGSEEILLLRPTQFYPSQLATETVTKMAVVASITLAVS